MSTSDHEQPSNVEPEQSPHAEEPNVSEEQRIYDVAPANVGDIEISFELDTEGLDEGEIQKLRERAYSHERHSQLLDTIIKSALGPFGASGWVKWAFCRNDAQFTAEWQTKERFTKTYKIIPNYGRDGGQDAEEKIAVQTKVSNPYREKDTEINVKATQSFVNELRKGAYVQSDARVNEFVRTLASQTLDGNQKKVYPWRGCAKLYLACGHEGVPSSSIDSTAMF